MKVIMKTFFNIFLLSIFVCCSSSKDTTMEKIDYCKEIDILINEKSGNYFANKIIPKLERNSNIEASCQKGTFGYIYLSDSLFNSDIKKWKEYYKCE